MNLVFDQPLMLLLAPLMVLPWLWPGRRALPFSSLRIIPEDRSSDLINTLERVVTGLVIGALVLALGEPYRPQQRIPDVGEGVEMAILLDRSRSMDQPFHMPRAALRPAMSALELESKGQVARRMLARFASERKTDMLALAIFSTNTIPILPLTRKPEIIQAAIDAGNLGRGLAETDVGEALERVSRFFAGRPYTGSRVVLLISDGAAHLDLAARERISDTFRRHRLALYWLYTRSRNTPGVVDDAAPTESSAALNELLPHQALHRFFSNLGVPYKVYTAEDPEALERAIADVGRLQNLPLEYQRIIPRSDLAHVLRTAAILLLVPLVSLRLTEIRTWR